MHAVSVSPLGGEELNGSRLERQEVGKRSGREEKEKPARHREATEESGRGWGLLFPIRRGGRQEWTVSVSYMQQKPGPGSKTISPKDKATPPEDQRSALLSGAWFWGGL